MIVLPPPYSPDRLLAVLRHARRCLMVLFCVDAAWMLSAGIGIHFSWEDASQLSMLGVSGAVLLVTDWQRRNSSLFLAIHAFMLLFTGAYVLVVLCYLGASLRFPLVDPALIRIDHALGFDWKSYISWAGAHPMAQRAFSFAYGSMVPQILALTLVLAITKRMIELQRFVLAFLLSLFISVVVATCWPAMGAYYYYDINPESLGLHPVAGRIHEHDMLALRAGTLHEFPLYLKGIITFPSYHANMALLLLWAARAIKVWFPASVLLNIMMIFAVPMNGSHWLADIIGGVAVTMLTIACIAKLLPIPQAEQPKQ